jgi:hypothetical protein
MNYKQRIIEVFNESNRLYEQNKWIQCVRYIETLFDEIGIHSIRSWDTHKIKKIVKCKEFGKIIELHYELEFKVSAEDISFTVDEYVDIVIELVSYGLHIGRNSRLSGTIRSAELSKFTPDEVYNRLKKLTLDYIKVYGSETVSYFLEVEHIPKITYLSIISPIKSLTYVLPFIKNSCKRSIMDLPLWNAILINIMSSFSDFEDGINIGNLCVTIFKYTLCNTKDISVSKDTIISLTHHEHEVSVGELFKEPYFKTLLRRFLNIEKRCNVCYEMPSKVCARCKSVRYCGTECQALDWPNHKHICKMDYNEPPIELPECPKLEEIIRLIDIIELKYKDETWRPFD